MCGCLKITKTSLLILHLREGGKKQLQSEHTRTTCAGDKLHGM